MATLDIGVMTGLSDKPEEEIGKVAGLGLTSCQICTWNPDFFEESIGRATVEAAQAAGVTISTLWAGWPGPKVWNFTEGPTTIGLVPAEFRAERVAALVKAARMAAAVGLSSITTHVGFIPEDPNDPVFADVVDALKTIAGACVDGGIDFLFETGQETPVTLLRTIQAVGTGNLGINLDPANLILYGKANPIDALDVFGTYVRNTHAKDGLYPTDGASLGKEVPIGQGKVDFPTLVAKLKGLGYTGPLTIEREISGSQQIADIKAAVAYLRPLC